MHTARGTFSGTLLQQNRRQTRKSSSAVVAAVAVATLVANLSSLAESFSTTAAVGRTHSRRSQTRNDPRPVCVAAGGVARSTTKRPAAAAHSSDSGGHASGSCYSASISTRRIGDRHKRSRSSVLTGMTAHGEATSSTVQCAPTTIMSDDGGSGGSVDGISDTRHRHRSPHAGGTAAELREGDPIEFWHAKGLVLGNYEGPVPGRRSLAVRTEAGEALVIDAGQVVGLWVEDEMRGPLPSGAAEWSSLEVEATALLQGMPTRGLDLGPFWRAASSRGKGFLVTAAHAAEFLFAEDRVKMGLKKRRPFQFRGCVGVAVGGARNATRLFLFYIMQCVEVVHATASST